MVFVMGLLYLANKMHMPTLAWDLFNTFQGLHVNTDVSGCINHEHLKLCKPQGLLRPVIVVDM